MSDPKKEKTRSAPAKVYCAFDKMESPESLQLHPRNPNQHSPEQLRLYLKIVTANGWRRPAVVSRRSGFVTKGNGAVLAARLGGLALMPVHYQDYPSDHAELQDMLADNELARLSKSNETELDKILKDLSAAGTDLELAGILQSLQEPPAELKPLSIQAPPKMAWVLIGIPLVDYARIAPSIEKIATEPAALVESTFSDEPDQKDRQS